MISPAIITFNLNIIIKLHAMICQHCELFFLDALYYQKKTLLSGYKLNLIISGVADLPCCFSNIHSKEFPDNLCNYKFQYD